MKTNLLIWVASSLFCAHSLNVHVKPMAGRHALRQASDQEPDLQPFCLRFLGVKKNMSVMIPYRWNQMMYSTKEMYRCSTWSEVLNAKSHANIQATNRSESRHVGSLCMYRIIYNIYTVVYVHMILCIYIYIHIYWRTWIPPWNLPDFSDTYHFFGLVSAHVRCHLSVP